MKKVAVTGANGFIGRHLVRHALSIGWEVVGLARRGESESEEAFNRFELSGPPPGEALEGCNALVHTAHAMYSPQQGEADLVNIEGSKRLFECARNKGVGKIIYLSSLSSHPSAQSHYGQSKLAVESLLDPERDCILRLGMILGPGGFVERTRDILRRSRFVPLPDGGRQPVYVMHVSDLCRVVERTVRQELKGVFHVAHPADLTVSQVYRSLAKGTRKRPVFLPVPLSWLFAFVRMAESLGFTFPVSSENLLGLRAAGKLPVAPDMERIGVRVSSFDELVEYGCFDEPAESRRESEPPLLLRLARPGEKEIIEYAREETDYRNVARFQAITRGPVFGVALIVGVFLAAAVLVPFRVIKRFFRRARVA